MNNSRQQELEKMRKMIRHKFRADTNICPSGYILDRNGDRVFARTDAGSIKRNEIVMVVNVDTVFPQVVVRKMANLSTPI